MEANATVLSKVPQTSAFRAASVTNITCIAIKGADLLDLGDVHQVSLSHQKIQDLGEVHVLGDISRACFELWIVLHEALHVRDRLNLLIATAHALEVVHKAVDCLRKIACRAIR